jgi:hypothetical protein
MRPKRIPAVVSFVTLALVGASVLPAQEATPEPPEAEKPAAGTPAAPETTAAPEAKPADPGLTGSVLVGGQGLSEDPPNAAKFFEYRDIPSGFVAERIDLFWTPKPRSFFSLEARDLAQQDGRGVAEFGTFDVWRGSIFWSDNPRQWGDDAEQLWAGQGDAIFTLDDSFQSAVQAAPAAVDTTPADGQWDAGTKGALIKTATLESAQDIEVLHQRKTAGAALAWTPTRSWTLSIDATRERRSGTAPQSLGNQFSLAPGEVAAPVDFKTDWANLRAEYQRPTWNVGGQVGVSRFETGYPSLVWDNQLSLVDQPATPNLQSIPGRERQLLGTDNDSLIATLFGGVNLPGRTRLDVTVSQTAVTQDAAFLPMTINTQLSPLVAPLPQESLDGDHGYTFASVRASSRPVAGFRWSAWARRYELTNDSPSLEFPEYVSTDYSIPLCGNAAACGATTNRIARRSLPYAFQRDSYGALAGWSPVQWFDASVSYEQFEVTREHSAVEKTGEDRYRLTLDFDAGEHVLIRTTASRWERRADDYDANYFEESFPIGEANVAAVNEGERRFVWTDRDRDAYALSVEWTPNPVWSVYAQASYARSDYFDPVSGLEIGDSFTVLEDRNPVDGVPESYSLLLAGRTFDRDRSYSIGATISPQPRFSLYADYTWEEWEYRMVSRYRNVSAGVGTDLPEDDWGSDADDVYKTATLGVLLDLDAASLWKLDVHGSWARGTGRLTTDFVQGGSSSGNTTLPEFPRLENTLTIGAAQLSRKVGRNLSWVARYWYERWKEDNWASDFMQPYMGDPGNDPGSVNAVYLGLDFDNYTYQVVSLLLQYAF